ncbi:MAG: MBOAT family protein [Lachnospiraceae bacterium]|nr:MBOAT family protein [Lachnospiraceae bacterium]
MLFTSMEFLFLFFPIVLVGYYLFPHRLRNYLLLVSSLFFYAWGEPKFVFIMLGSIVLNYIAARWIERLGRKKRVRKTVLILTVLINISLLFVFKYLNFVTELLQKPLSACGVSLKVTEIALPIGISFFTFQALSYVVDVYRGIPAQKNICNLGLYISLFPQLIAGPIVRYTTIMDQIKRRVITWDDFSKGMLRFLYGFNKKMLLANLLSKVADAAFAAKELSVGMAWLGAIAYALQIYFDFSGYSEMAIGLGQMFGFHFLENFNYPYISKTVSEFWRRWHISLGTWFRDYVYFPLGGSRVKSKWRLVFNLSVVWLATGIWHGANWTFLLWGALHGIIIIAEKLLVLPDRLKNGRIASVGYQVFTMAAVLFGWVLFRADGISQAVTYMKAMLALNGNAWIDDTMLFHLREHGVLLAAGIICALPLFRCLGEAFKKKGGWLSAGAEYIASGTQAVLFLLSVSYLVMDAHNPFIYFNF